MTEGTLYGIGIGPGDPELITLKGLRLLRQVRRVFLPATAPGRSFAGAIAECHLDRDRQDVVELVCPPLRDRAALLQRWTELAHEVAAALRDGETAAFLTEGDPSLYSTFQYLRLALARDHRDVRVEVVPGVTSACAAAAVAGVPLAMWDETVAIVPGSASAATLDTALAGFDCVVVLKPARAAAAVRDALQAGAALNVTLVRRAGRPEELVVRGPRALDAVDDYFSLLIVQHARAAEAE